MNAAQLQIISPATHPEYRKIVAPLAEACWPEFMLNDPVADEHWSALFERFSDYQFGLYDCEKEKIAAMGNSVPLHWEGGLDELPEAGWDWALDKAVQDHRENLRPTLQCAIQVAIHPEYQGRALSTMMVEAMRSIGAARGFGQLVAPVRPSQKERYPLADIDHYVAWKTEKGELFDAWLRVHARLGAKIVKVCHRSMLIRGSLKDWEAWTGLKFPESGKYVVPGGLNPVDVDVSSDEGVYIEPNVWMVHSLN